MSKGRTGTEVLDELQSEAEKLLSLLNDRQLGLMSWDMFFVGRLKNIHNLIVSLTGVSKCTLSVAEQVEQVKSMMHGEGGNYGS
jgi:hypothetical protein